MLANGEVVKASAKKNNDLFYGVPGTAGTLGILTAAEVNLIPAKKYVELTYIPVTSFKNAKDTIETACRSNVDFVDSIIFSKDSGVVIVGKFSNTVKANVQRFSRAHDQWYYLHVQHTYAVSPAGWTETVPLTDYLFRYDRGAFWVGRFAFEMFGVPYTPVSYTHLTLPTIYSV